MNSNNLLLLVVVPLIIIISSTIVCFGDDDDEKCKNDYHSLISCLKEQHNKDKSESEKAAAKTAVEQKVDKCFAQSGCAGGPDWSAVDDESKSKSKSTGAGAFGGGAGKYEMPASVKECVKRKVTAKINQKVNECLSKRGIKNVNLTEFAYEHDGSTQLHHQPGNNGTGGKGGIQMIMKAKYNVVKAVDKCCQQKGGDTNSVKPLEQCLQNIKHDEQPQKCAKMKPCQDKVSKPCQKRGEDVRGALCLCKKEKESDTSKKLRALGQSQKNVSMGDLMKTMADQQDMNEILTDVGNCYTENNKSEPILLKLFKMMSSGGFQGRAGNGRFGGGGSGSMTASTVIIMSDMLELDAQDQTECKPCQ